MGPMGFSSELIDDQQRLAALEPEWWNLWHRCPEAQPFLAPAWLLPWWHQFYPGPLFVLAVRKDGQLVGFAPAYIECSSERRILPLGISVSDHLDVLADPDYVQPTVAAFASAAQAHGLAWDAWVFEELLPNALALKIPVPPGCWEQVEHQHACPILAIPDNIEDLGFVLPKKKRRSISLAINRCRRRGPVQVERARGSGVLDALEHLIKLHQLRWESRGETGVLAAKQVQDFHRIAVPQLEKSGLLRLYTLSIAGGVVAAYYGLVHRKRAYAYLTGIDPNYLFESPGVVLMTHAFREALSEGCREIDFLRGREPYKYNWGAIERWNMKRTIRGSTRAQTGSAKHLGK